MDKIIIKDFEVRACHGVNPEEKTEKQRFLFMAIMSVDIRKAAMSDDLNETVSYAAVKKRIQSFCEGNCFDLIETLASRLAEVILIEFPKVREIDLTVKKPDAPMSGIFDYVAVNVKSAWHKVYLGLGSSVGDRNEYLDFAIGELGKDDRIASVRESERIETKPYGGVAKQSFLNSAAECDTLYTPDELLVKIHAIERDGGRVRKERWGDRTLDIDILFYDDMVIEEDELCVPHADMANRAFVLRPLAELCPNKVHPLLNVRVRDMLTCLGGAES